MKTETKQKLIPVLKAVSALLEKCGGPGGTPGPCPVGGGKKPSVGKTEYQRMESRRLTHAAHDASIHANKTKPHSGSDRANLAALQAKQHTATALNAKNDSHAAKAAHRKAHDMHRIAETEHGKGEGASHQKAAKAHRQAAESHAFMAGN